MTNGYALKNQRKFYRGQNKSGFTRRVESVKRRKPLAKLEQVEKGDASYEFDRFQISPFGAYLFSDYLHCIGDKLSLKVTLPENNISFEIESEVVHTNKDINPGMGVVFLSMSLESKKHLQDYVTQRYI